MTATAPVPIPGARVTAGSASGTSDAAGCYTLAQLAPGPTSVTATAQGFDHAVPAPLTVPSGSTITQEFSLNETEPPGPGPHRM